MPHDSPHSGPHAGPPAPPDAAARDHAPLKTERALWTAEFSKVMAWVLAIQWSMVLVPAVVTLGLPAIILVPLLGVPLVLFVLAIGVAAMVALAHRYLASLTCVLTTRSVRASGGVLFKWERSIPLDKITDVTMSQGPIARLFDVEYLGVETAGGGGGPGNSGPTIPLFGVVNPREFRRAVLEQRDRVVGTAESREPHAQAAGTVVSSGTSAAAIAGDGVRELLVEIRDELRALRIENARRDGRAE